MRGAAGGHRSICACARIRFPPQPLLCALKLLGSKSAHPKINPCQLQASLRSEAPTTLACITLCLADSGHPIILCSVRCYAEADGVSRHSRNDVVNLNRATKGLL